MFCSTETNSHCSRAIRVLRISFHWQVNSTCVGRMKASYRRSRSGVLIRIVRPRRRYLGRRFAGSSTVAFALGLAIASLALGLWVESVEATVHCTPLDWRYGPGPGGSIVS